LPYFLGRQGTAAPISISARGQRGWHRSGEVKVDGWGNPRIPGIALAKGTGPSKFVRVECAHGDRFGDYKRDIYSGFTADRDADLRGDHFFVPKRRVAPFHHLAPDVGCRAKARSGSRARRNVSATCDALRDDLNTLMP
jgi:hypothetical protein